MLHWGCLVQAWCVVVVLALVDGEDCMVEVEVDGAVYEVSADGASRADLESFARETGLAVDVEGGLDVLERALAVRRAACRLSLDVTIGSERATLDWPRTASEAVVAEAGATRASLQLGRFSGDDHVSRNTSSSRTPLRDSRDPERERL